MFRMMRLSRLSHPHSGSPLGLTRLELEIVTGRLMELTDSRSKSRVLARRLRMCIFPYV